jgi:hypothetical protein
MPDMEFLSMLPIPKGEKGKRGNAMQTNHIICEVISAMRALSTK